MDSLHNLLDRMLSVVFGSATLYGAGGAYINARRRGKSLSQTVTEMLGGALTANIVMPIVQEYSPERLHYTLFFLVGWGGLEFVGRMYEAFAQGMEDRIRRRMETRQHRPDDDQGGE